MLLRGLAICTSPRSGSNYVGQILSATNQLGHPLEYFNGPGRRATEAPDYPDDLVAQFEWILSKGATPNGVYGVKLFPDVFASVLKQIDVFAALPNLAFLRLERRDRLGQAISWARALQTQQFRADHPTKASPIYDSRKIMTKLVDIARANASWDVYFDRTQIPVKTIFYEDVLAGPDAMVEGIASFLGLEQAPRIDWTRVTIARQRDALNERWRTQFLNEFGGRHWIDVM